MSRDKALKQWGVLDAMTRLPPFGNTAEQINNAIVNGVASGTRTRLKELRDMALVKATKEAGDRHTRYWLTEPAWALAKSGPKGVTVLKSLRAAHATIEAERAAELAPIKQKWQSVIELKMSLITQSMLGSAK